jgi:hypothetical protein
MPQKPFQVWIWRDQHARSGVIRRECIKHQRWAQHTRRAAIRLASMYRLSTDDRAQEIMTPPHCIDSCVCSHWLPPQPRAYHCYSQEQQLCCCLKLPNKVDFRPFLIT